MEGGEKWKVVNAGQSVDQVHDEIWEIVQETIEKVHLKPSLGKLWLQGTIDISDISPIDDKDKENRSLL
jgi:hypothetical protein